MKIGTTDITGGYVGSQALDKIMVGSDEVWSTGEDYQHLPFFVENTSNYNMTVGVLKSSSSSPTVSNIQISYDNSTWTYLGSTSTTALNITLQPKTRVYYRCNTNYWGVQTGYGYYNYFKFTGGSATVGGNIMSLLYGSNFTGNETTFPGSYIKQFRALFMNSSVVSAKNLILPAVTLTQSCYASMFYECTKLVSPPKIRANTLAVECCSYMFYGCTSLTTLPALPATILAKQCYSLMFYNCTSLTSGLSILPATTLEESCYSNMFGYSSIPSAPLLPATTLTKSCYDQMFIGCANLTTAPELPATTLAESCYSFMFYNCTSLNYIKCLATDISASNCTNAWVVNVSATGTFVKDPNMSSWTSGDAGIPSGWTIQNA